MFQMSKYSLLTFQTNKTHIWRIKSKNLIFISKFLIWRGLSMKIKNHGKNLLSVKKSLSRKAGTGEQFVQSQDFICHLTNLWPYQLYFISKYFTQHQNYVKHPENFIQKTFWQNLLVRLHLSSDLNMTIFSP